MLLSSEDYKYPAGMTVQMDSGVEVTQFYLTWTWGGPSSARHPGIPVSMKPMMGFSLQLCISKPFISINPTSNGSCPKQSLGRWPCHGQLSLSGGIATNAWFSTLHIMMRNRCPTPRCPKGQIKKKSSEYILQIEVGSALQYRRSD